MFKRVPRARSVHFQWRIIRGVRLSAGTDEQALNAGYGSQTLLIPDDSEAGAVHHLDFSSRNPLETRFEVRRFSNP